MAMTKKERADVDALVGKVRMLAALRWTDSVKPDVPPPSHNERGNRLTTGYLFSGGSSPRVMPSCSSSVSHGTDRTDKTQSQGPRALYSTRLLALKAMRHQLEIKYAEELARVDLLIEAEEVSA